MKLISWNVNGIRAVLKKGFLDFVKKENPDILCLQETKAHPEQVDDMLEKYSHHFWCSGTRKGYAGVAVFSKIKPLSISNNGLNLVEDEGRILTLEFDDFYLVNVYTPNSKRDLSRVNFRHKEWDPAFLSHLKKLEKKKPVIFCGDLNCAQEEIDIARPQSNKTTENRPGNAGFTDMEREGMRKITSNFIDTYRYVHGQKVQYTWWSYLGNARANNVGWRIDYFGTSKDLKNKIKDAKILDKIMGSDHCPVSLELS